MGNVWCSKSQPDWCTTCNTDRRSLRSRPNLVDPYTQNARDRTITSSTDESSIDGEQVPTKRNDSLNANAPTSHQPTEQQLAIAYDGWKKAIESGNESLAAFLMEEAEEYPIDLFQYHWDNCDSALNIAVKRNHARLVFFLLTKGASVNEQNANTLDSPLHIAVRNKHYKIIDLLLKWGADVLISNYNRETPITISNTYKDHSIYEMLAAFTDNGPQLDRLTTNADRFAALQRIVSINTSKQYHADANYVLGIDEKETDTINNMEFATMTKKDYEEMVQKHNKKSVKEKKRKSEMALKANKIAGENPFTNLGRRTTAKRGNIIKENLELKPLPTLESWIEKRKPGRVPTYQKRWIIVRGAHMLWSRKQRDIVNDADRKQRKKFNGYIHLTTIDTITKVQTKSNNKFMVKAKDIKQGNVMREYIFRCESTQNRDFWVNGLREHKKQYQTLLKYLGR